MQEARTKEFPEPKHQKPSLGKIVHVPREPGLPVPISGSLQLVSFRDTARMARVLAMQLGNGAASSAAFCHPFSKGGSRMWFAGAIAGRQ